MMTTDIAIPEERAKSERELRSEIINLEAKYERLKSTYDGMIAVIANISDEFKDEISKIREEERKTLESYFEDHEQRLLDWIAVKGEEEQIQLLEQFSEEHQDLCKKLYRSIALQTHPDHDPEGIHIVKFEEANEAYECGDIFTLRLIRKELDSGDDSYSRHLGGTIDELTKKRDDTAILVQQLNKHVQEFEFGGIKISDYLSESRLNTRKLNSDIRVALGRKLRSYEALERKEEEPEEVSEETALVKAQPGDALTIIDEETKERNLETKIRRVLKKIDRISPYYPGFGDSEIFCIFMYSDESDFSERLNVLSSCIDYTAKGHDRVLPEYRRLIDIGDLSRDICRFLLDYGGEIIIPEQTKNRYTETIRALDNAENMLDKPIRVLTVSYEGQNRPILGAYYEHTCETWLDQKYRLTSTNEIMFNRLVRAMALLKIPRITVYEDVIEQDVYVEETEDCYPYDGSSGPRKDGDIVKMRVHEKNANRELTGREIDIRGRITDVEARQLDDPRFHRLLGCSRINFQGYLDLEQKVPFSMNYKSDGALCHSIHSIRDSGGVELEMTINKKNVSIKYDRVPGSNDYVLNIVGMEAELFPDLVFKIVESLRIEKVRGVHRWSEVDKIDYM